MIGLDDSERRLLRQVHRWARRAGWRRAHSVDVAQWGWTHPAGWVSVDLEPIGDDDARVAFEYHHTNGEFAPSSIRQAVDALAAMHLLPVSVTTAYRAGRATASLEMVLAAIAAGDPSVETTTNTEV